MKKIFVTGTDTEIGKTYTTEHLAKALRQHQRHVLCFKPVAAGAEWIDGQLKNEDALALLPAASEELNYEAVNPFCFEEPMAPHIAAEKKGVEVTTDGIRQALDLDQYTTEIALVEGAGGWLVPLNQKESFADIPAALGCDVLLVVGLRLGCINHALLTVESIRARGLNIVGWVANQVDPDMLAYRSNIDTLKRLIEAPMIAEVIRGGELELDNESIAQLIM